MRETRITYNGPIPAGLNVLHHCDTPPCISRQLVSAIWRGEVWRHLEAK